MMGMEMMLAKMLGITPDQMKEQIGQFSTFVKTGMEALIKIDKTQTEILERLEAMENGRGK